MLEKIVDAHGVRDKKDSPSTLVDRIGVGGRGTFTTNSRNTPVYETDTTNPNPKPTIFAQSTNRVGGRARFGSIRIAHRLVYVNHVPEKVVSYPRY